MLKLVEAFDSLCNEIWVLTDESDGIGTPVHTGGNTAIASNVFCQVNAMREQEHATKLQCRICQSEREGCGGYQLVSRRNWNPLFSEEWDPLQLQ